MEDDWRLRSYLRKRWALPFIVRRHLPKDIKELEESKMADSHYMRRAIELAELGSGWVNPNPLVGAVVVKDGRVIGEGYHQRYGDPHAERNALLAASESPEGSTLFVTLEPCCHTGKTPPCTQAILEAKIARVVIGSDDPNPLNAGKGIEQLREAGLEVTTGFMRAECNKLNRIFFHYILNKTPYVMMKYAMTLDGKIATRTGSSKWITGPEAREDVHRIRGRYAAIMVGIGTVLADDPLLNCRIEGGHSPLRVICDSALRIPTDSRIVSTAPEIPTIIVTVSDDETKAARLQALGCEVLVQPTDQPRIDLPALMAYLGERGIDSVLLEGGGMLNWSALEAGIVNRVRCYVAPSIFGGKDALTPVEALGVALPIEAFSLSDLTVERFGDDLCIEGEVQ
jgi:diaminohydroxyphosphoribosylaminopyrimidine deaminase/5-amino-6-(5-phosphoribosylamino)uracil reductase